MEMWRSIWVAHEEGIRKMCRTVVSNDANTKQEFCKDVMYTDEGSMKLCSSVVSDDATTKIVSCKDVALLSHACVGVVCDVRASMRSRPFGRGRSRKRGRKRKGGRRSRLQSSSEQSVTATVSHNHARFDMLKEAEVVARETWELGKQAMEERGRAEVGGGASNTIISVNIRELRNDVSLRNQVGKD
ncbi:hypothetical protein VNO78_02991 [Psophocarpus tetragonolobus]|uniref:Uncharacterized protein n=1 Tax=Psophocarpus tetragonolobus TaxID=3891 RepID=A0AAN9XW72_PSOTE